jgi:hypothetical protein
VRILGSPRCRWSLPLVREEEDNGCGGGALGAPLSVALLSVPSLSGLMRSGMIYLQSSSPPRIRPIPYILR